MRKGKKILLGFCAFLLGLGLYGCSRDVSNPDIQPKTESADYLKDRAAAGSETEGDPQAGADGDAVESDPQAVLSEDAVESDPQAGADGDAVENDPQAGADGDAVLIYEGSMELQYAQNFTVDYYKGGYTLLTTTMDGAQFLIVPEGKKLPENIDIDLLHIEHAGNKTAAGGSPARTTADDVQKNKMTILHRPIKDIYLVASSAMDMFCAMDGLDAITFSGQPEDGWYIEAAREAMARGDIVYAGKYNKPDYELIVAKNCSLAIENTMISHAPEVPEKLGDFGIPVITECSSYESHPLGRVEWVKFYGALLGKEAEAEQIFGEQQAILERVSTDARTDKIVAFFFITSNGLVQVRQSADYVPKMIALAGGKYVFDDLGEPMAGRSTVNMQVEEFYAGAKDADYLIYNSSIDGGISSVEELLDKCGLLADFKAVKEGNVWCTTNDMYQQSLSIGYFIEDIYKMLQGKKDAMHYLFPLE